MPRTNFASANVTTFHTTNCGWNYFTELSTNGTSFRTGRYLSNGHVNTNTQTSNWQKGAAPTNRQDADRNFCDNRQF